MNLLSLYLISMMLKMLKRKLAVFTFKISIKKYLLTLYAV